MKILLFATIFFSGLVAGLLFAYSCSVNPGLKSLPDKEYIAAMQSINKAIQNPFFFISFMGLLILFPVTAWQLYGRSGTLFYMFATAMAIYVTGVFGVTIFGSVPLNEQLAKFSLPAASENEISYMRNIFEKSWNNWHTCRMVAAIVSFGCTILSVMTGKIL